MISANFIDTIADRLRKIYGLDVRALSLMRILVALVLLTDLLIRSGSLSAHYTVTGAVPFTEVETIYWQKGYFSLFSFCDAYWYVALLFIATAAFYVFLLLGYKTRLFTFLSWVMLVSLQNRNTLIIQGGDDALRLLLFWGMFLPWGNFYSLDGKHASHNIANKYFSLASFGYVMLIFSVYFFSAMLKTSPEWDLREGTALYYALNIDQTTWSSGRYLLQYPELLKYITVAIKWLELFAPLLLFIPFKNQLFRMLFILLFAAFNIGIASFLFVGLFFLINIVSLTGLLSSKTMDAFDRFVKMKPHEIMVTSANSLTGKLRDNYYFKVLRNCFLFFCLALTIIWNLGTVPASGLSVSKNFFSFGYALRLDQAWGMFAPTVLKADGWYVMEGTQPDSSRIDINRNGSAADHAKPQSVLALIENDRWRKFGENYMLDQNAFMRPFYCNYLFREWNKHNPERKIIDLKIIYMKELTPPPGKAFQVTPEMLCDCKN